MSKKPFNYERATNHYNRSPTRDFWPISIKDGIVRYGHDYKRSQELPRPEQTCGLPPASPRGKLGGVGHGKPANRNKRGSATGESSTAGRSRQFAEMYSLFGSQSSLYDGDLTIGPGSKGGHAWRDEATESDARSSGTNSSLGPTASGTSSSFGFSSRSSSSWGLPSSGFSTDGSGTSMPMQYLSGPGLGEARRSLGSGLSSGSSSTESSPSDDSASGKRGGPGSQIWQEHKQHKDSGMCFPYILSECPMLETYHRLPKLQPGDPMQRAEEALDRFTNIHWPTYIPGVIAQAPNDISFCRCVLDRWQQTLKAVNHDIPVHFMRCVCDQCGNACASLTCMVFEGDKKVRIMQDACPECFLGDDKTVFDYAARLCLD